MIAARPALTALVALAVAGVAAGPARAGWSQATQLAGPFAFDILPAQISFAANGEAAIAYTTQDADEPAVSSSFVIERPRDGRPGPSRAVPGALQILAVGFPGSLTMLTGSSPAGDSCCTVAQLVRAQEGPMAAPGTLLAGLTGATVGELVTPDGRRALAAIATDRGVWVTQSSPAGQFPPVRRLTATSDHPLTLAAARLAGDRTIVAWAAQSSPRSIFIATGTRLRGPRGRRAAVVVPNGHEVDELAAAGSTSLATVAWIESWLDSHGVYHSQPVAEDLGPSARARPFAVGSDVASGLTLAADSRGDQVMSWEQCTSAGTCSVLAASRPAGRRFGAPQQLGAIDPSQSPVATISPAGEAFVGWIWQGEVVVAATPALPASSLTSVSGSATPRSSSSSSGSSSSRSVAPARFGVARVISGTNLASDLTLAFGPVGEALAVWTQGTVAPALEGAVYRVGS